MGVDAGFFAKKAKRYFWFDRLYNIEAYNHDDVWTKELDDIYYKLRNERSASASEVLALLEANIKAWMLEPEDQGYHVGWCKAAMEFVKTFSDDEFFVSGDNHDAYDLIGSMYGEAGHWTGEYMEWVDG